MEASPAPTTERLQRANNLIMEAVNGGAQLIVLPEVFNTGYEYSENNYARAEDIDDRTATWMRATAQKNSVHLAGSFLLRDSDEVFNSLLLFAPDGRYWRYDKNYPWGWERAYFREGRGITIAETAIGKIGLMICWDYAHPKLWKRYAGRVDMMVISSSPPRMGQMEIAFEDGERVRFSEQKMVYNGVDEPFGKDMDAQAAWLRVPVINTTGAGRLSSHVPAARLSMSFGLISRPALWSKVTEAHKAKVEAGYYQQTKIIDAAGHVIAHVETDTDDLTTAEVYLPDETPQPLTDQPNLPYAWLGYFYSDTILPMLTTSHYRKGYRQQFGDEMAPLDRSTRLWRMAVISALFVGFLLGRFFA